MPRGRSPCTQAPSAPSISELDPRCFQGRIASVVLSSSAVEGFQNLDSSVPVNGSRLACCGLLRVRGRGGRRWQVGSAGVEGYRGRRTVVCGAWCL